MLIIYMDMDMGRTRRRAFAPCVWARVRAPPGAGQRGRVAGDDGSPRALWASVVNTAGGHECCARVTGASARIISRERDNDFLPPVETRGRLAWARLRTDMRPHSCRA